MSYKSNFSNNLHLYFCSNCDNILNEGAFKNKNTGEILCIFCFSKFNHSSPNSISESNENEQFEECEVVQEISECLKMIEDTIRVTRSQKKINLMKIEKDCQCCSKNNNSNKAELFCVVDKVFLCQRCFQESHQHIIHKYHQTMSLEKWSEMFHKEHEQEKKIEHEEREWFCSKHLTNPLFCLSDQILFCNECEEKKHLGHKIQNVENQCFEIKERINNDNFQKNLSEHILELNNIEMSFKQVVEIIEKQKKKSEQMVEELRKDLIRLRETKELWNELIDESVDDKEWCKNDFVEKVGSQIVKVEEKWIEREKMIRIKSKDIIGEIKHNLELFETIICLTKKERFNFIVDQMRNGKVNKTNLKKMKWYSIVDKGDMNVTAKYLKQFADLGDSQSQLNLGWCYDNGEGVDKDLKEAVKYYQLSAEQGNPVAQFNLACCFDNGEGVEKDSKEAIKYYQLSAEQGNASAQNNLGVCFHKGFGVKKNLNEALKYYQLSSNQGDDEAQNNLGEFFINGERGKKKMKNIKEAVNYFKLSADQGNSSAQNNLGECFKNGFGVEKDLKEAVKYFKLSSDQGNAKARNNLGLCYKNGLGVEKDLIESIKYFQLSSDQRNPDAQNNLGLCFLNGVGVKKNKKLAIKYFTLSYDQGNENAKINLQKLIK